MTSHKGHNHPATPAARAACRKGTAPPAVPSRPSRNEAAQSLRDRILAERAAAREAFTGPRNRAGFPLRTCDRCGGSGRMPFAAYNGVCLKCGGTGALHLNNSSKRQYTAYTEAVIAHQATSPFDVRVGDRILVTVGMMGATRRWEVVEKITRRGGHVGSSTTGNVTTNWTHTLNIQTKSSGFTLMYTDAGRTHSGGDVRVYRGPVDPTPYLNKINYR